MSGSTPPPAPARGALALRDEVELLRWPAAAAFDPPATLLLGD